jgi:cytochrome bd ubiquinol oxidase subunit I
MDHLFTARSQMALSLAFHIIFAVVGIGMPVLMVVAEALYIKTKDNIYLELAKKWSKGVAIMFAVGAVSGTILSFELGLLWPDFMALAGPIIGMPFSLEGFAFFMEAIFLGIYLYGWKLVSQKIHLFSGIMVAISGALSGIFVVCANAWMNTPAGFELKNGVVSNIDPIKAMFNPSWFTQTFHMTVASYISVGFAVAGLHAFLLLKKYRSDFHKKAFLLSLTVAGIFVPLQFISGDLSAKHIAKYQPAKFAAMEGHWETTSQAHFNILGWPNEKTEKTDYAIKVPYLLSFLAHGDTTTPVIGLKDFKKENRPPIAIVHISFQIMIASALMMLITALWAGYLKIRKQNLFDNKLLLWLSVICAPLGFIAVEAGWMVTEVGRQPFIINGIMLTKDAVTNVPYLGATFSLFLLIYCVLFIAVVYLMKQQVLLSLGVDDADD